MIHQLESNSLVVSIKEKGAELCSIKSVLSNSEFIWQADPSIWGSHAPNLFPIIGCLKEGTTNIEGKPYSIPKHGLLRNSDNFKLATKTDHKLTFEFSWNEQTLSVYPFKFIIQLTYELWDTSLSVHHRIVNLDGKNMYYSLGGHPAFNFPIRNEEAYEDGFIEFEHIENDHTWLLNDDGLVTNEQKSILTNTNKLELHEHLFDNDALILKNLQSRKVWLKSRTSGPILSLEFKDFEYLGIWAKPGAPYVCIEPWLGIADSENSNQEFIQKEGIQLLQAGDEVTKSYTIEILGHETK